MAEKRTDGGPGGTRADLDGVAAAAAALIAGIAERTNLVALNASLHAARAAEAGRGFALAAGEIQQIAARIGSIQGTLQRTTRTETRRDDVPSVHDASSRDALLRELSGISTEGGALILGDSSVDGGRRSQPARSSDPEKLPRNDDVKAFFDRLGAA